MQKKRIAVAVFFAAFWLLGLLTAADYGPSWDEQDEMDILRMNLWEYARILHLDEEAFQARAQADDTLTIGPLTPISQSIEQDHGIAAFYPLAGVAPGTEVHVDRADGSTVTFRVSAVRTVAKDGFPTEEVYAPTLQSSLRLVTCGGPFDQAVGSYRDNVIVSADPVR